jgi:hypothetical protein
MSQTTLFTMEQQELTSNDYYTPKWIFDELGLEFDLDPSQPPGGLDHIPAKNYFTQADDGLAQEWFGRVWMNPPFKGVRPWVEKFVQHGNGVGLLGVSKSKWFQELWNGPTAIVWMPRTLQFIDPKGSDGQIWMPCVMIALGDENIRALSKLGKIR